MALVTAEISFQWLTEKSLPGILAMSSRVGAPFHSAIFASVCSGGGEEDEVTGGEDEVTDVVITGSSTGGLVVGERLVVDTMVLEQGSKRTPLR